MVERSLYFAQLKCRAITLPSADLSPAARSACCAAIASGGWFRRRARNRARIAAASAAPGAATSFPPPITWRSAEELARLRRFPKAARGAVRGQIGKGSGDPSAQADAPRASLPNPAAVICAASLRHQETRCDLRQKPSGKQRLTVFRSLWSVVPGAPPLLAKFNRCGHL